MATKKVRQQVDAAEEPSVDWGWHGSFPLATPAAGVVSILILLGMLVGNHQGRIENLYLIGSAVFVAVGLVFYFRKRRNAWRR